MIDFSLEPELELLQETARRFAEDHLRPNVREFERVRGVSDAASAAFDQTGLADVELPEGVDGAGLGAIARALVLEELAAVDPGATLALDLPGLATYPLLEHGGEGALRDLALPLRAEPGARAVAAWDLEGRLRVEAGHVRGELPWVPADRIDLLVVGTPDGAFVVREGLEVEAVRGSGLRAAGASAVRLDGATLLHSWSDPPGARRALARARLYVAALLVGVARSASDFARAYSLEREAFGRPIAHHQGLAFLIVDMATGVSGARLLVQEAAWRLDAGEPAEEACATAFAEAIEQAMFVTPNAVQVLGAHGFMQDYPVEKHMREARTLGLLLGGTDAAREEAGRRLVEGEGRVSLSVGEP
jgi:alkylation response protein AidB-like acyl-CoA dehydrogenase